MKTKEKTMKKKMCCSNVNLIRLAQKTKTRERDFLFLCHI